MLGNQAMSLSRPGRIPNMSCTPCPEMPENQAISLSWPGCVPHMACTSCPRNYLEMPESQVASLLRPRRVLCMACTPYPWNSQEIPGNVLASMTWPTHRVAFMCLKKACVPAVARSHPGHGLHTVCHKLLRNAEKSAWVLGVACAPCPRNAQKRALSLTWPAHLVLEIA
ncbi:Hypothetical predicted protein [Olea europaea subsp. europaea]|uniref:Uncharacterized protein n=1 Tax=Olea europaea subsp. europaea TaxID=158383 RepID=A0A8S0T4Z5_OLEEU|nr:Hypothetical predicted protein [Olea europaea subsp. europaea]